MRRNKVVVVVVDIVGHCLFELVFALASFRFARRLYRADASWWCLTRSSIFT